MFLTGLCIDSPRVRGWRHMHGKVQAISGYLPMRHEIGVIRSSGVPILMAVCCVTPVNRASSRWIVHFPGGYASSWWVVYPYGYDGHVASKPWVTRIHGKHTAPMDRIPIHGNGCPFRIVFHPSHEQISTSKMHLSLHIPPHLWISIKFMNIPLHPWSIKSVHNEILLS